MDIGAALEGAPISIQQPEIILREKSEDRSEMNPFVTMFLSSWLAGLAALFGGGIARLEHSPDNMTKREIIHGIVAFGGGILVAAVAFALAPEGIKQLSAFSLTAVFCAGGGAFCILDAWISNHGGSRAQFMAMLMDFLPEAIALGAVFAQDPHLGLLLALFIGAQNLPEGFNAYRELMKTGANPNHVVVVLGAVSFLGPVAAGGGYLFLRDQAALTAGIMNFAAGGILYLVFQDIAPKSPMRRHWTPPLGAVLGFVVGMVGKKLLG